LAVVAVYGAMVADALQGCPAGAGAVDAETGTPPAELATELLGAGLDLLTAKGANVVWGASPEGLLNRDLRRELLLRVAIPSLRQSRSDLRSTEYLSGVSSGPGTPALTRVVDIVLEGLRAYRRTVGDDLLRMMVVGDSQAKSVGYGLERLEADTGGAVVWNLAAPGCGIANVGTVRDVVSDAGKNPCRLASTPSSAGPPTSTMTAPSGPSASSDSTSMCCPPC
jgi:hypothetical protein